MAQRPPTDPAPDRPASVRPASEPAPAPSPAPGVLTALLCDNCGNEDLIRVKGCWYCEKCHYKFDCYGF
jgi:hypothetical protein